MTRPGFSRQAFAMQRTPNARQKLGNKALHSDWKSGNLVVFSAAVLTFSVFLAH
jgi:hypothetical protein